MFLVWNVAKAEGAGLAVTSISERTEQEWEWSLTAKSVQLSNPEKHLSYSYLLQRGNMHIWTASNQHGGEEARLFDPHFKPLRTRVLRSRANSICKVETEKGQLPQHHVSQQQRGECKATPKRHQTSLLYHSRNLSLWMTCTWRQGCLQH